jgi:hypothetical protein
MAKPAIPASGITLPLGLCFRRVRHAPSARGWLVVVIGCMEAVFLAPKCTAFMNHLNAASNRV